MSYLIVDKIAKKYFGRNLDYLIVAVSSIIKYEKRLLKKDYYSKTVFLNFENLKVPVPVGFDDILKQYYGNYFEYPPIDKRGNWHHDLIFDVDTPYKGFLRNYRESLIKP